MSLEELKKALKEEKLVYGKDRVLKMLRAGKASELYFASNCPITLKEESKNLAKIDNVKFYELKETNEELGTICKKTFSISIACN